ncbi:MAG TPA: hypothetical protein VFF72_12490 [Caldimonas sp.]|nr:hypothetical protein [Caldimonas sp.]
MHRQIPAAVLVCGLFAAGASFAQAPSGAPAGSTGMCKDGTYTTHSTKKGACAGHKGVKDWFEAAAAAPAMKPAETTTSTKAMPAPSATTTSTTKTASMAPAAGGGPGQVWVNTSTKVYHCQGTKYYGKTKHGEYMTEAAAKAAGDHADHGKACS